jgi:hypothetical protein
MVYHLQWDSVRHQPKSYDCHLVYTKGRLRNIRIPAMTPSSTAQTRHGSIPHAWNMVYIPVRDKGPAKYRPRAT